MRILLVEDDALLGDGLKAALKQEGYAVDWAQDGEEGDLALRTEPYDIVVLDLGLPGLSGLEVLDAVRKRGSDVPVLVLTAQDTSKDRVKGLDLGADDYMVKPFSIDELCARIRSVLRRAHGRSTPMLTHGDLVMDVSGRTVALDGENMELSAKEFAVLHQLLENQGRVISKGRLEEGMYDWESELESNAVEVYVHHLRKKLGKDLIRTIRGVGYVIDKETSS
jgi:two-component system response regulator QseB